jgi:AraC family transcriptional regulator
MDSQAVNPISARDLPLETLPFLLNPVSSEGQVAEFPDVYAINVETFGQQDNFAPLPVKEHMLGIPVKAKGKAVARIGSLKASFIHAQPGTGLSLVPAGTDSEWRISGRNLSILLFVSQALVTSVAINAVDINAANLELIPALFFADLLIFHLGTTIAQCIGRRDPLDHLFLESLSQTLTMHLIRHYSCGPTSHFTVKGKLSGLRLKQTMDYIATQPLQSLKIKELAQLVNLSPFYFERLFKATLGKTVHQYVLEQQLKKSVDLLLKSNLTIAQIATELGFADQAHFNRQFKAAYGVAPGVLRKDSILFQSSPHENTSH